jgi:hypothetical protein
MRCPLRSPRYSPTPSGGHDARVLTARPCGDTLEGANSLDRNLTKTSERNAMSVFTATEFDYLEDGASSLASRPTARAARHTSPPWAAPSMPTSIED